MDYIINIDTIQSKKIELNALKTNVVQITNEVSTGYINSVNGTEISSLITKIKNSSERLNKAYTNSCNWLDRYITAINDLENKLASQKLSNNETVKAFQGEFVDIFSKQVIPILKTGYEPKGFSISDSNGALTGLTFRGTDYNIVNTKIPLQTYEAYIQKNGLYQNAGLLGGQCMLLSQYYASDMLSGKYTSRSTMQGHGGAPAVKMNEGMTNVEAQPVLDYVYNEINEGNPVVLQVSQKLSYKGLRHLVTVVGYASNVKSAADLTPDNILVLDCVDGKIQTLGQARSEGGHERRLYNQNGKYLAYGPTEKFKATIA